MDNSKKRLFASFAVLAFTLCVFAGIAITDDNEVDAASGSAITGTVGQSLEVKIYTNSAMTSSQLGLRVITSDNLPNGLEAEWRYNSGVGAANRGELWVVGTPTENASGTYTITWKPNSGSSSSSDVTGSISITGGTVEVSSISITGSTSAEVGDSITYTASVSPSNADNKAVTWSISSGASYATITSQNDSSCTVKFNSAGSVTIKATADDGSGTTATRTVSVTKPDVPVTSITISGSSSAEVGDTKTYSVSVSPSNATDKGITWSISSGSNRATIISQSNTSCTVSFTAAGSVTLRATADDGYGEYDTHTITVSNPMVAYTLERRIQRTSQSDRQFVNWLRDVHLENQRAYMGWTHLPRLEGQQHGHHIPARSELHHIQHIHDDVCPVGGGCHRHHLLCTYRSLPDSR